MSASGLTTLLSLPASLKVLKVLEVRQQGPQKYVLDYSSALLEALGLPKVSLESLSLSLRNPQQSPFSHDFDMSSFHALRLLRISFQSLSKPSYPTSLGWAIYAPPALDTLVFSHVSPRDTHDYLTLTSDLGASLKSLEPAEARNLARTVCLSLIPSSFPQLEDRKTVEKLGHLFRLGTSQIPSTFFGAASGEEEHGDGPRLRLYFTRSRGAMAPYLYREHEPEEDLLYESSSQGSGWLTGNVHGSFPLFFSHSVDNVAPDHFMQTTDDSSAQLNFGFHVNHIPASDMHLSYDLFDTGQGWPALDSPLSPEGFQNWPSEVDAGAEETRGSNPDWIASSMNGLMPPPLPYSAGVAPAHGLAEEDTASLD